MKKTYGILLILLVTFLLSPVSAYTAQATPPTVYSTVDTTIVNSPYLDVNIWILILLLGVLFFIMSRTPYFDNGTRAVWALLCPFFTLGAAYFSSMLQYTSTTTFYNQTANTVQVISEHFIYHLDWLAVGLLGILFIFSFINAWAVLMEKPVEKPTKEEF